MGQNLTGASLWLFGFQSWETECFIWNKLMSHRIAISRKQEYKTHWTGLVQSMVAAHYLTYLYHYSSENIHSQENLSPLFMTTHLHRYTRECSDSSKLISHQQGEGSSIGYTSIYEDRREKTWLDFAAWRFPSDLVCLYAVTPDLYNFLHTK